jgi:hypothetical protein
VAEAAVVGIKHAAARKSAPRSLSSRATGPIPTN